MFYKIKRWYREIFVWWDNICRICYFIPILWKDWDFDAKPGLYRIIKAKLDRLEPQLEHGHLVGGSRYARQIRVVRNVLQRLIDDEYDEKELEDYYKKYGRIEIRWEPDGSGMYETLIDSSDDGLSDEEIKEKNKEFMDAIDKAYAKQRKDSEFVFRMIHRWHLRWWD